MNRTSGRSSHHRGRRLGALLVLTALAACSRATTLPLAGPDRDHADLSAAEITAIASLLRFEDRRAYDTAAFNRIAADGGVEVRRRAVTAAARIGDPAAATLLLRLLASDPAAAVRADAAFGLGLLGHAAPEVVEGLIAALGPAGLPARPGDLPVAMEAISALGHLGGGAARAAVHRLLDAARPRVPAAHRRLAGEALLAVWRFEDGAGNASAAARYLDAPDPELRWRAAYALMRGGDPSALPHLLAMGEAEEHRVREYAARALTAPSADSAGVAEQSRAWLLRALADRHPHVRINAVRSLAGYGDRVAVDTIAPLLRDPVPAVAVAAAGVLGRRGAAGAASLADALNDPGVPLPVRGQVLARLAEADPGRAVEPIRDWASADAHRRYFAAVAAAGLPPEDGLPLARRLAHDTSAVVAAAGATAAAAHGDTLGAVMRELTERATRHRRAAPPDPTTAELRHYEDLVRHYIAPVLAGEARPRARVTTRHGSITLELLGDEAPLTVHNFVRLANAGYFDGGVWHRVIPNFVLQDGAPAGLADGGPGWTIRDEINRVRYGRGVLGMALSGPDTGGSQWFITHSPQPHLDGGYTVFGRVVEGQEVADAVLQGDRISSIRILP